MVQKQAKPENDVTSMTNADLKLLQTIPGVGKSIARDLVNLGVFKIEDLKGRDAQILYDSLCKFQEHHVDRCMLYVLRAAVYFAENPPHFFGENNTQNSRMNKRQKRSKSDVEDPLYLWWNWSDEKISKRPKKLPET